MKGSLPVVDALDACKTKQLASRKLVDSLGSPPEDAWDFPIGCCKALLASPDEYMVVGLKAIEWPDRDSQLPSPEQDADLLALQTVMQLWEKPLEASGKLSHSELGDQISVCVMLEADADERQAIEHLELTAAFRHVPVTMILRDAKTLEILARLDLTMSLLERQEVSFPEVKGEHNRYRIEIRHLLGIRAVFTVAS